MRTLIVSGSRTIRDPKRVFKAVDTAPLSFDEVAVGCAKKGVDKIVRDYATGPIRVFEADWDKHGKAAGPIRNREMAEYGDFLVAVWDGQSRGTKNMIEEAIKRNMPVFCRF